MGLEWKREVLASVRQGERLVRLSRVPPPVPPRRAPRPAPDPY